MSNDGLCPNHMSNGGSCPNNICPVVVLCPNNICLLVTWIQFINIYIYIYIYMFINETLVNPSLLNSEVILK